jgi:hypothetical protein
MKKSQGEATTATSLGEKFDLGYDVLDYIDVRKTRVVDPQSERPSACHAEAGRRRVIREKPARYSKKTG